MILHLEPVVKFVTCRRILFVVMTAGIVINNMLYSAMNIPLVALTSDEFSDTNESFNWTESQKQTILGTFFWGYAISKIPTGSLSEIIGPKKVIGYTTLLSAILTIVTPFIMQMNYYIFLSFRVLIGFLLGALFPCQLPLCIRWYSPKSQSSFMSSVEATSLGIALTYFLSGFLITAYGWRSVFYTIGFLAVVWTLLWFFLVYDSPEQHPRISVQEKEKILQEIGGNVAKRISVFEVPWKSIVMSLPVWAIVFAQIPNYFTVTALTNELPSYLEDIFELDIVNNGIYSSLPHLGKYFAALFFGYFGDYLLRSKKLSRPGLRKVSEGIALLIPAVLIFLAAFFGGDLIVSIFIFVLTLSFSSACVSGHYVNMLDIAPNFSGTIAGIIYTFSGIAGYMSTEITAALLNNGHSFQEWRYIFFITAAFNVIGGFFFLTFCSTDVQSWNSLP